MAYREGLEHFDRVQELVNRITYRPNTGFRVLTKNGLVFLQHWQSIEGEIQTGRKWYVSQYAVDSEIIQTALLATKVFEEHETRESFRFDGARIFNPHIDIKAQREASRTIQVRQRGVVPALAGGSSNDGKGNGADGGYEDSPIGSEWTGEVRPAVHAG